MLDPEQCTDAERTGLRRRHVLAGMAAAGAATMLPSLLRNEAFADVPELPRWSDPTSWGGSVPGTGAVVTVAQPTLLDTDVQVAGLVIAPGASLVFDPAKSVSVVSSGNVEVFG